MTESVDPHRLPRTVLPKRYELELTPDVAAATFAGHEVVDVAVLEAVDEVVLNSAELEITSAWIDVDGARIDATPLLDVDAERLTLRLAQPLDPGTARVHLSFRGALNDKLRGFYRSTFRDADGDAGSLATTQFESTDARRAFPCWDEPDMKAVFSVAIVADAQQLVVSNAREVSRDALGDGLVRVQFADTMPMSTYLVAFVVGPLEATDPVDVDGVPLRVICPPGTKHLSGFALEVGAFALRYFRDYFDIDYPGDKLDLVGIPDFAFGAMENVGCVTFRETLLLVDPAQATQSELRSVVRVISHEIAHMWFGDLVTMKWWNGIWLNEAFATLMEVKCTDAFRPAWQEWTSFGLARSTAFDTDALTTTRPVEYPVVSPEDADGMFDVLTYEKGGSVLRMLELYLGEERFREGIRRYMTEHAYGNTETTDLWDAIEAATTEPVRRVMDSWIFRGGHPVVSVELRADGRSVHLDQRRFLYLADEQADVTDDSVWGIPMLLAVDGDVRRILLDDLSLDLELPQRPLVVRPNAGGAGFYRVHYSPELRASLAAQVGDLDAVERYMLVDDTWASVLAGTTSATEYLDLVDQFDRELDVAVWKRLVASLDTVTRIVDDADALAMLRDRIAAVIGPVAERLGAPRDTEDDRTRELRGLLLEARGALAADPKAIELARGMLDRYFDDVNDVEPNVAAASLRVVATHASPDDSARIRERFRNAATPQEKQRFLFSLARQRDPALFAETLELSLSDEVRTQDAPYLLREALANDANSAAAWRTVRGAWETELARFPHNSIGRMLEGIRTIIDPALAADVAAFLAEHPVPQSELNTAQHLERMRVSVAVAERERAGLVQRLRSR